MLHKYEEIAEHGSDPAIRTKARQLILKTKKEIMEERRILAPAELQYIRDIEKGWVSLVSLESHEREASRQHHASMAVQVDPTRSLSKMERLLGSDGSSLGISSFTQPPSSSLQPTLSKTSCGGVEVVSTDVNGCYPRGQLASTANPSSWPDKSYEILIPDWFPVAEAQGNIETKGDTAEIRFLSLLNYISRLEIMKRQDEDKGIYPNEEGIVEDRTWDKRWHEPNPGWRYEHHRLRGGWWKCRKGPMATAAENRCRPCEEEEKPNRNASTPPTPSKPPAIALDEVMGQIETAMAVVAAHDKENVLKRIAEEKSKTSGLEALRRQTGEKMGIWGFGQDDQIYATGPETNPSSSRQPGINYNPLRGVDDSSEVMARSRSFEQQTAPKKEEQETHHKEDGRKGKEVSKSGSADGKPLSWEVIRNSS